MEYRILEEYPNYKISEYGAVINITTDKEVAFSYKGRDRCYKYVWVVKEGNKYNRYVHRLVAMAFIPNPDNLPQVNHIDGDKMNNHYSNLEWCNNSYNIKHTVDLKGRKRVTPADIQPILQYSLDGVFIAEYLSANAASKAITGTGKASGNILKVCKCEQYCKTAKGYIWKFKT